MATAQPDKTGMHILLKLASPLLFSPGFMPRRILLYNSCWRSFFAIVLNPLVTGLFAGA